MTRRSVLNPLLPLTLAGLVSCATPPVAHVSRKANVATPPTAATGDAITNSSPTTPVIHRGTETPFRSFAAPANVPATQGGPKSMFNFQGESIQVVAAAILGDVLKQNYVISPNVQGSVTLNTSKPVDHAEALRLLDEALAMNNARMIYANGRYNILPADQATNSGLVSPSTRTTVAGYQVRPVALHFIAAEEMKKILDPFARPNAIVGVDGSRNVLTLAGTPAELANYQRTIDTFDVDWMASMSVGVFPLQSGRASAVAGDLDRVFGSKTPTAGMMRFMPLESANALLVITSQPRYLDQVQGWIERIDGSGDNAQLHAYELRYITARDLAQRLGEVFGTGSSSGGANAAANSLMPGLQSTEIRDPGLGSSGTSTASIGGLGQGAALPTAAAGPGSVNLKVGNDAVGVSAVDETNTLLVRSSPAAWRSIQEVIQRLDVMPLQVQIEAQIAEVKLTGDLKYGVNWYLENAIADPDIRSATQARHSFADIAGSITAPSSTSPGGLAWSFIGHNALAVINALDQVTDVRLLQTPSVVVRNNADATLNVGSRIPIASVTVNPGIGNTATFSQVQYLDTGTILKVRPRVTRDGMVFLDLVQEVSSPGSVADAFGNVRIDTRRLQTQAAIQSGDTIMLAGLISDQATRGSAGMPGLSRIPVVGGLFGTKTERKDRTEVIILLTPTLIRNPQDARNLTDDYSRQFKAIEPIRPR